MYITKQIYDKLCIIRNQKHNKKEGEEFNYQCTTTDIDKIINILGQLYMIVNNKNTYEIEDIISMLENGFDYKDTNNNMAILSKYLGRYYIKGLLLYLPYLNTFKTKEKSKKITIYKLESLTNYVPYNELIYYDKDTHKKKTILEDIPRNNLEDIDIK